VNPVQLARPEIAALQGYRSARQEAAASGRLLNANENPDPPAGDHGWALNRYPEPQPRALIERLADLYRVQPEQLLVSRGSDEAIDLLVRAFCRPGRDRVAWCPPTFGMYAVATAIQDAGPAPIPLGPPPDWRLPFDALVAAQPRLTFLCSPNNPTGHSLPAEQALELARALENIGLVVVDEAYIEFSPHASLAPEVARQSNLAVLRTLSKAHALAGLRCGALVAEPAVIELLRRIMAPYPLPTPTARLATEALDAERRYRQHLDTILEERQRLRAGLESLPAIDTVWPSDANFLLLRTRDDAAAVAGRAAAAGILLRDFSATPALENCLRISVGTPQDNDALLAFLAGESGASQREARA